MKHAVMIIGYGKGNIVQRTISILDDKDIDFYIHWDARHKLPQLYSIKSKIFWVKNRLKVKWGSYTLIQATLKLMKQVHQSSCTYSYIHLISSNDVPLMTANYFKNFFKDDVYLGFRHPVGKKLIERINFYYPHNIDYRKHPFVRRGFILLNRILRINRLSKKEKMSLKKGPEWFSIKYEYMLEVLNSNRLNQFKYALCADEMLAQTILSRFDTNCDIEENTQAARYINWKDGASSPCTLTIEDYPNLKKIINTKYAFARKIEDVKVAKLLHDAISQKE